MTFELLTPTLAKLASVTNRCEKHGDEDVPAVSLGLRITAANTLLDVLSPGLLGMLYMAPPVPDAQASIEGTEATHLPLLRSRMIEKLSLKGELNGWTTTIDFGIDDDSDIVLGGCKVDKFAVMPSEGGSIELSLRIGTSDLDELKAGRLAMLNGHEIMFRLAAPTAPVDAIDASSTGDWRQQSTPTAGDLFAQEFDGPSDREIVSFGAADNIDDDGPQDLEDRLASAFAAVDNNDELDEISDAEGLDMHGVEEDAADVPAPAPRTAPRKGVAYRCRETGATWSGCGLKPRWLVLALEAGRTLAEFVVAPESDGVAASRRRMQSAAPAPGAIE